MSAPAQDVLSRDELQALLESIQQAQREHQRGIPGARASSEELSARASRDFEPFCHALGSLFTTRFQTLIRVTLLDAQVSTLPALSCMLLPADSLVLLGPDEATVAGAIAPNRALLFGWLSRCFGARPGAPSPWLDGRPYTRIEQRFLMRFAEFVLGLLREQVPAWVGAELAPMAAVTADALGERVEEDALLLELEVSGFEEAGRLRIALACDRTGARAGEPVPTGRLQDQVLATHVEVRALLGTAELSLAQLASLEVGALIPIETRRDGSLELCVEGAPKFTALRGRLGARRAVRVLEREGAI